MASRSPDLKTPLARIAYADNFFKARAMDEAKKPRFGCTLLIPKSVDITALKKAAQEASIAEWGDKAATFASSGLIKTPFLDGDGPQAVSKKTGQRHAGHEGHIFIRCASTIQPKAYDQNVLPAGPDVIYSGCYGFAVVHAYTWDDPRNGKGVSFGISMFQFVKDGERMAGGDADPDSFFEKIPTDSTPAPAATQGGAGAAGFFA